MVGGMLDLYRDRPFARRRFQAIVDVARETNPFYARWIDDPENVPVLPRRTFVEHNDEILDGREANGLTSGSTMRPVRFIQTAAWSRLAREETARFVALLGGRLPAIQIIYTGHDAPQPNQLSVHSTMDEQIDFILRMRREIGVRAVTTYPTNALLLSRAILERGVDLSFITRVGLYAEVVEPHHRELVARAFPNATLWTTYSSKEFGMIAYECPFEPGFHHISAGRLGVEVLVDGRPAEDGELGQVVITDYFNRATPFIRYEIGDLAARGHCPCGRTRLPALSEVRGKTRGALLHRNGNRVAFTDLSVSLMEIRGMRQFQVIQEQVDRFVVKAVAIRTVDGEVRRAFSDHFGYEPHELQIDYVEDIPLEPSGKFHASICRV